MRSTIFLLLILSQSITAKVLVHGHRGARAIYPENTIPGFHYALDIGVDVLEFDLAVTKDNHLVVTHDLTINQKICRHKNDKKITKRTKIRDLTLAELKNFDCGSLRDPIFPNQTITKGTTIPTLEEVFQLVTSLKTPTAKKVKFNMETKIIPSKPDLSVSPHFFAKLIIKTAKKHKVLDRIIVQSFDHRTLEAIKSINPKIEIAPLIGWTYLDYHLIAKNLGAKHILANSNFIDKAAVKKLHDAKIKVSAWTANTIQEWRYLLEIGVDGIVTDDPAKLIALLRKERSTPSKEAP